MRPPARIAVRAAMLAAAAIGGGVALGRKAIDKKIDERVSAEVEAAKARALAELDKTVAGVVRERLGAFATSLAIKAALFAAAYALFATGNLTPTGFRVVVAGFVAVFIARDAASILPYALPAFRLARRHGWSPKRVVTELVAGVVFERAYADALVAAQTGSNKLWIALSNYNAQAVSTNAADAIARVAAEAGWPRVRSRVLIALALAGAMSATYTAFVAVTLHAA